MRLSLFGERRGIASPLRFPDDAHASANCACSISSPDQRGAASKHIEKGREYPQLPPKEHQQPQEDKREYDRSQPELLAHAQEQPYLLQCLHARIIARLGCHLLQKWFAESAGMGCTAGNGIRIQVGAIIACKGETSASEGRCDVQVRGRAGKGRYAG